MSTYLAPNGCVTVPTSNLTGGASMILKRSAVSNSCSMRAVARTHLVHPFTAYEHWSSVNVEMWKSLPAL